MSFAIGRHGNPDHRPVGGLHVWNDDDLAAQSGFSMRRHADVEIIAYVREGVITHEDSLGYRGRTGAGDVQVMSAGTGITHSEHDDEATPWMTRCPSTPMATCTAPCSPGATTWGFPCWMARVPTPCLRAEWLTSMASA